MKKRTQERALGALAAGLVLVGLLVALSAGTRVQAAPRLLGPLSGSLSIVGNHFVANGSPIVLHGVNRSGTEYGCIQGWGIFDGPSDAASVAALASWGVTLVRIPLNEDCWLGINGVPAAYAGANYIGAIKAYVALLHADGIYAELSLMWGAPGAYQATYQPGAPDADHSPAMWSSLATTFAGDPNVILAPWGETITGWTCFMLTGCNDQATYGPQNAGYQTAPMQQAVTLMRAAGYHGPIAVPCIDYANECANYNGSSWLQTHPTDPDNQLAAEAHIYGNNACGSQSGGVCLNTNDGPLAASVPFLIGEMGETYDDSECGHANTATIKAWADAHGVSWEAWTWDTWGNCEALIANYNGAVNTSSPGGATYPQYIHDSLLGYAGASGTPTATSAPTHTPSPSTTATSTPSPTATSVVPPTATPTSSPSATPSATPSPSPTGTPPPPGKLTLVQAHTQFIDYSGANESYSAFASLVHGGDLLVATVAIAGGNGYRVDHVDDDLGNTWHRAAAGVNGDNSDAEIWYAVAQGSGPDEIDAYLACVSQCRSLFAQTLMTAAEFHGAASATTTATGGHAAASGLKTHGCGAVPAAHVGDLVVGMYVDAGYLRQLAIADGKSALGTKLDAFDAVNGIQSYGYAVSGATGATASASYTSSGNAYAEVACATFTAK